MAEGFRKSFFGFNCDDVMAYINKAHKRFTEKEDVLKEINAELTSDLEDAKSEILKQNLKIQELEAQLDIFKSKQEELERLSEEIGQLYIVSKQNAISIIENAEETRKAAQEEVMRNITAIENAHKLLEEIKTNVTETSLEFSDKVTTLSNELDNAKSEISIKDAQSQVCEDDVLNLISETTE